MRTLRDRPRILVIDDEQQIRRFLRISLNSQGYDVVEARDATEGLARLETSEPDLVMLDLGLPGRDGRVVLDEIRTRSTNLPVLILSVRADEGGKVDALDAGANDYVTKPFGLPELLARVRNLLRRPGDATPEPTVYDDGQLYVNPESREVRLEGEPVHLTGKEHGVLRMLLQDRGRVVTQRQLLREVWGPTHTEHTHYLRIIVGRLRGKLGDDPTEPVYIHTEAGVGYRFEGRGDDAGA